MKAAILHRSSAPMTVQSVMVSKPAPREVLVQLAVAGYLRGKLRLDQLISRCRPLSEINEAFDDLRQGEVARSVIMFER